MNETDKEYYDSIKEKKDFEKAVKIEILKAWTKVKRRFGYDDYLALKVDLFYLDDHWRTEEKVEVLDEREHGFCAFCGKETYYFYSDFSLTDKNKLGFEGYICARCLADLMKQKE